MELFSSDNTYFIKNIIKPYIYLYLTYCIVIFHILYPYAKLYIQVIYIDLIDKDQTSYIEIDALDFNIC